MGHCEQDTTLFLVKKGLILEAFTFVTYMVVFYDFLVQDCFQDERAQVSN